MLQIENTGANTTVHINEKSRTNSWRVVPLAYPRSSIKSSTPRSIFRKRKSTRIKGLAPETASKRKDSTCNESNSSTGGLDEQQINLIESLTIFTTSWTIFSDLNQLEVLSQCKKSRNLCNPTGKTFSRRRCLN